MMMPAIALRGTVPLLRGIRLVARAVVVGALFGCTKIAKIDETTASEPIGAWDQGVSASCASLYPKEWRPTVGLDTQRPSSIPKPARGLAFADARYKTCIVRVTDHAADQVPGFARNDYSRRQAFNADNSKIVVSASDGTWHTYDVATRAHVAKLEGPGGDAEPQWHPTDPNLLYYFPGFGIGMQILELDLTTGKTRAVADLASRIKAIWPNANSAWTKSEGSPSRDARYWGLMVDDAEWHGLGLVTYDLRSDKILGTYDFGKKGKGRPDHVSMSLSGAYMVASWEDGTYSFTPDFATGDRVHKKSEHSDLALDENGDDVYVSIDYDARGGPVFMKNLKTGKRTELLSTYLDHTSTAIHFSGRSFLKPGWVLVSTYAEKGSWQWMHRKIFAMELKERPRIVHVAHHHVAYKDYFTEPHASVNRDFTRVIFGSNWESSETSDIDSYVVDLPKAALAAARP